VELLYMGVHQLHIHGGQDAPGTTELSRAVTAGG
jgi:hypothetical protein